MNYHNLYNDLLELTQDYSNQGVYNRLDIVHDCYLFVIDNNIEPCSENLREVIKKLHYMNVINRKVCYNEEADETAPNVNQVRVLLIQSITERLKQYDVYSQI